MEGSTVPDFLNSALAHAPHVQPLDVLIRLLIALGFALVIAWLYRRVRRGGPGDMVFPSTLVLICVLIAMVTQVIGDSVARAFSLVGALSIVRFRTVVRDTRDTAYVIFVVAIGMAVGASSLWVAAIGLGVVALAELVFLACEWTKDPPLPEFTLKLRGALDQDLAAIANAALEGQVTELLLVSIGTAKQGDALEALYRLRAVRDTSAEKLMQLLSRQAGVVGVQLIRRGYEDD